MFANWLEDSWNNLNDIPHFWYYVAGGGGAFVLIAVLFYLFPRTKVPGIALSLVGGVGIGLAVGVFLMVWLGYQPKKTDGEGSAENPQGAPGGRGPGLMGGPGGGGGGPMMGGGFGGGGGGGARNKAQLASLVAKLDDLTDKPLQIQLNDKQKKEIKELLDGLDQLDELTDDAAKEKSEKLHELLKTQKDTLVKAGYRWPGEGRGGFGGGGGGAMGGGGPMGGGGRMGGGGPMGGGGRMGGGGPMGGGGRRGGGDNAQEGPKNPFKEKPNAEHLKDLTDRLGKSQA